MNLADEVAALLCDMRIPSTISNSDDVKAIGQDGFDYVISIDPKQPNWKKALALSLAGGSGKVILIFAPLYIPTGVEFGKQIRNAENTVLLRHIKAYDPMEVAHIERFDGLVKIHYHA